MRDSDVATPRSSAASSSPTLAAGQSIAAPAIRGSVWTLAGYALSQLIRLGGNLVLTRLLFPEVFGQMALVFLFIQGLAMFSDVGTGPAIIQNPRGDDPRFLNTAWTIQCARGVLLWLVSWAIAWPVAAFYDQPLLRWLIPAGGFTAALGGFESTAMHTLQRHLRLERLTIADLAAQLLGIAVTILLAFVDRRVFGPNHPGAVWAIIAGALVTSIARLVLSHTYLPGIRHRFRVDAEDRKVLFRFGRWIFVSTLLTFLAGQSDRLVFGKLIPIALFGVYSIASMIAALPTAAILKLGGSVVFPAYSRLAGRTDFRSVFFRVRWPLLLGGAAVVTCLIASGPFLVAFLYDRRYADAGWMLQFLSAAAWFQILECTNGAVLLAKGHVRWVAAGNAAKLLGMIALVPLGFRVAGLPGALAGLVVSDLLKYLTVAAGVAIAGLGGIRHDLLVTAMTALLAAAAFLVGRGAAGAGAGRTVSFLASGAAAGVPWLGVGLWYLARSRADRVARADLFDASPGRQV